MFLVLTFFLVLTQFTQAQTIYNGDFENWTNIPPFNYEQPEFWVTSNTAGVPSGLPANVTKTTDAQSGSFAMKLETITEPGTSDPYIGGAVYGNALGGDGSPEKLSGYFKATLMGSDVCGIGIFLKGNGMLVGGGDIEFDTNADEYTYFEMPIEYFLPTPPPDTVSITVLTSTDDATPGTTLILDGLTFGLVNSVEVPLFPAFKTLISPNPASAEVRVEVPQDAGEVVFTAFDASGKKLEVVRFIHRTSLTVSSFANGQYFYEVRKGNGQLLDGGGFNILR